MKEINNWMPDSEGVEKALKEVFESGDWWRYTGKRVKELERSFACGHDTLYGIALCNGTVALDIILRGLGIGSGDEVILPAYDFYSLPRSVRNVGAEPCFVDVRRDNFTIDTDLLESKLTSRTKAVVAVHISGSVAELDRLAQFCTFEGIDLIEDCAQAHGAVYGTGKVGSWGRTGLFSFGGVKLMTSGQGGMIVTSDKDLYQRCYAMVNRGHLPDGKINRLGIVGENFQLSEIAAAILLPQLENLQRLCRKREEAFRYLEAKLGKIESIEVLRQFPKTSRRAHMRFAFLLNDQAGISGKELVTTLGEAGFPAIIPGAYSCVAQDPRLQGQFGVGEETFPNALYGQKNMIHIHHTFFLKPAEQLDALVDRIKGLVSGNR